MPLIEIMVPAPVADVIKTKGLFWLRVEEIVDVKSENAGRIPKIRSKPESSINAGNKGGCVMIDKLQGLGFLSNFTIPSFGFFSTISVS